MYDVETMQKWFCHRNTANGHSLFGIPMTVDVIIMIMFNVYINLGRLNLMPNDVEQTFVGMSRIPESVESVMFNVQSCELNFDFIFMEVMHIAHTHTSCLA